MLVHFLKAGGSLEPFRYKWLELMMFAKFWLQ